MKPLNDVIAACPPSGIRRFFDIAAEMDDVISLGVGEPVSCASVPGGGTLPGVEIPSAGVAVGGDHAAALRARQPPIIARFADGRTVCDLRTVDPADDAHLATALRSLPLPA